MVDWSRVKYGVMMEGLTAKFSLPQEKEVLISTHPAMLLEASSDTDWGTGERLEQRMRVGRGDNNLGKLLMILRDTIIKGEQQVPMFEDSDQDFRSCASSPTPSVQTMNSAPWGSTVVSISQQPTVELEKENKQVMVPTVELVNGPEQKMEQKIRKLNVLRKHFEFEKLVVIASAKCPVMVAKVKNGFSVDITVGGANDMKGIYNSLAINILGKIDERFRIMFCA
uniref:NADAR domain-containing protein n=1 Tax=Meloidogyne javanica TaxID=6303 RepID=A0A915N361_MELJA